MDFIRSVLVQDETPPGDGVYSYDLPVNPLSHIVLTLKALNLTANTKATLAQLLGALEKVEVLFKGQALISVSGSDLYALNCALIGKEPWQENVINTENAVRHLSLMIPMGRSLYNPEECFPESKKGELKLQIQVDITDTGYDGVIFQIETVELIDASPAKFLKMTTLSLTPSATGDVDLDLPIGNSIAGILLYGTTVPTGISWTSTIDKIRLLANNKEKGFANCNWESLHGDFINRLGPAGAWGEKFHLENTATAYTQNADTATEEQDDSDIAHYALMDYGIGIPEEFLLITDGLSRLHLRITAGDTNVLRAIAIELVESGKAAE